MGVVLAPEVRRRRDELVRRASAASGAAEVFAAASRRLRALVPHDASAWLATDPGTGFPAAPTRIEGITGVTAQTCSDHWRHEFVDDDVNRFRDLARTRTAASALRTQAARPAPRSGGRPDGPGALVFDGRGRLASADEQAVAWLDELPRDDAVSTDLAVQVPIWLLMTATRARDAGDGTARLRVRSVRGRWLVCHASTTRGADGTPSATVMVIEPAAPDLVAPILAEAHGLTEREQQVTRLVVRGAGTEEIARALFLSPHTVKDYIKAVLAKVGVASRGELVAALYADYFEPEHLAAAARHPA